MAAPGRPAPATVSEATNSRVQHATRPVSPRMARFSPRRTPWQCKWWMFQTHLPPEAPRPAPAVCPAPPLPWSVPAPARGSAAARAAWLNRRALGGRRSFRPFSFSTLAAGRGQSMPAATTSGRCRGITCWHDVAGHSATAKPPSLQRRRCQPATDYYPPGVQGTEFLPPAALFLKNRLETSVRGLRILILKLLFKVLVTLTRVFAARNCFGRS